MKEGRWKNIIKILIANVCEKDVSDANVFLRMSISCHHFPLGCRKK